MRFALPALLLAASVAYGQAASEPPKTRISGRILTVSGAPIPRASVEIRTTMPTGVQDLRNSTRVNADDEGNFAADGVPPGTYYVIAQKPGFVNEYYGSRTVGATGAPLVLKEGQTVSNIVIKMTPQSVISGTVTNPDGDPVEGTTVTLLRITYAQVRKGLSLVSSSRTNDRGEFRVANVAPGRYYLTAGASEFEAFVDKPTEKNQAAERLVTTYHPSALTVPTAKLIEVSAGADLSNTNIRMRREKTYTIRATAVDQNGGPIPNAALVIQDKSGTSTSSIAQVVAPLRSADGKFEFSGLLPGNYTIFAPNPPSIPDRNGFPPPPPLKGRVEIDIVTQDVNIEVRLTPGVDIAGAIRAEEDAADALKKASALVVGMSEYVIPGFNNRGTRAQPDGTFEAKDVARSTYSVSLTGLPQGLYLKSVRFGDTDVTRKPMTVVSGGTLDVVVSAKAADVSGVVRDSEGAAMTGATVAIWPADSTEANVRGGGLSERSGSNGEFRFDSLPPGDYYLAAWDQTESGIVDNPDFRALFTSDAIKVTLKESMHFTGEPKLISVERTNAQMAKLP